MKHPVLFRSALLIVALITFNFAIPAKNAHAAGLVVNTLTDENDGSCMDGDCSLRDAIEVSGAGDTITFSASGQINLVLGELIINKDLTITGPGSSQLTIDGNNTSRIFNLYAGNTVNISGMTMTHGYANPNNVCGGGAISSSAFLTMNDVVLTNNSAPADSSVGSTCTYPRGGAITVFDSSTGSLTISNSIISHNSTYWDGGGIYFRSDEGTLHLSNVIIDDNESTNAGAGGIYFEKGNAPAILDHVTLSNNNKDGFSQGGGIYLANGTTTSITNSSFLSNTAHEGGGIYAYTATVNIFNSVFSNNSAGDDGGALYLYNSQTTIQSSTLNGNQTTGGPNGDGGGIINQGNGGAGVLNIINSTLTGNQTSNGYGGALINRASGGNSTDIAATTIINSTLVGNNAPQSLFGGGIMATTASGSETSSVTLSNSIVYGNTLTAGVNGENCETQNNAIIVTNDHNLLQNLINDCNAGVNDIASSADVSTIVNDLANNGGPTETMSLPAGSPAIDTGNAAVCADTSTVNYKDQRGILRPQGPGCDIGAYEAPLASPIFSDVPNGYWAQIYIERLYNVGVTGGCGTNPLIYCPTSSVTRAQMAVFLLKGIHGSSYTPPIISGNTGFNDVPNSHWAAAWIKELATESITSGCGNGNYCPEDSVTRAQMAVFLLKAVNGSSYTPMNVAPTFNDTTGHWAEDWIEALKNANITSGCGNGNYCPDNAVTRDQMAVFLVKAFNLP